MVFSTNVLLDSLATTARTLLVVSYHLSLKKTNFTFYTTHKGNTPDLQRFGRDIRLVRTL
jgi:hypothetical protein